MTGSVMRVGVPRRNTEGIAFLSFVFPTPNYRVPTPLNDMEHRGRRLLDLPCRRAPSNFGGAGTKNQAN